MSLVHAPEFTDAELAELNIKFEKEAAGTVIRWNGQDRPTAIVDSTHLTAAIPAGDIANPGRAAVAAFNSFNGSGMSPSKGFLIGGPPQSASNAFVSVANPTGGSALPQRSIASLYGANLAAGVSVSDAAPLPFTLGDTTLLVGGMAADGP